jgi:hypothetical protein
MKFIVKPIQEKKPGGGGGPPMHTMCALCSEDPRFCDLWI